MRFQSLATRWRMFFDRQVPLLLTVAILGYSVLFIAVTWLKYRLYLYYDFDLATYNQSLWNTLRGHFFYVSTRQITLFLHLPIILFAILPLYAVFQRPELLLALLSIGLALGAVPVYCLAKKESGRSWGLTWALLYLLNPLIASINLFEFHPDGLSIPFWIGALHSFRSNYLGLFLVCLAAALSCKELFFIPVVMFGIYAFFQRKTFHWSFWPIVLGLG